MRKARIHYIKPDFYGKYYMFDWVQPYATEGEFFCHFVGMCIMAVFVSLGLFYRVAAVLYLLGFSYIFLLDACNYLNHHYLLILLCFLMVFLPANSTFSLDNLIFKWGTVGTVPLWSITLLRWQFVIVYFFAGVAKVGSFPHLLLNVLLTK